MGLYVVNSCGGHGYGFPDTVRYEGIFVFVPADDSVALLEVESALGDVVSDGDGDWMDIGGSDTSSIGGGLEDVVDPNDLER